MKNFCNGFGAIPSQEISALMEAGFIIGGQKDNVKPSSLDLSISDEIYEIQGMFQGNNSVSISSLLKEMKYKKHSLDLPLEKGNVYLSRLNEKLDLPSFMYGYCNPKSTTGRLDIHVRLMTDYNSWYDSVPLSYNGNLWVTIVPKSFSVKIPFGYSLNQIRFFNQDTRLQGKDLEFFMKSPGLLFNNEGSQITYKDLRVRDDDKSIILSLGLDSVVVGYKSIKTNEILDLSKNNYKTENFFEVLGHNGKYLSLKKDHFYLLSTKECLRVPPCFACEVASMDDRLGEFRSHYAGFIDPGWGWGDGKEKGRQITLEVRTFEDLLVDHGQPICRIKFERLTDLPMVNYDSLQSNYIKQVGPTLAKQFR